MKPMLAAGICMLMFTTTIALADGWKDDPVWHDGLVEKAVYSATRVVYGQPRAYQAIFFTNKEQHDRKTLTKANKSKDTIEVWKHNQIEDIPTPNYHYHYETTSHLAVKDLHLTRLDCSSQEFCGTSFKQFLQISPDAWDYWAFSYMPEAGRVHETIAKKDRMLLPLDALPLALRDYDFAKRAPAQLTILPSQKSNGPSQFQPIDAEIHFAGDQDGSWKLDLLIDGKVSGSYWMAADRLHVMTKYQSADESQKYDLQSVQRVNYWTIHGQR